MFERAYWLYPPPVSDCYPTLFIPLLRQPYTHLSPSDVSQCPFFIVLIPPSYGILAVALIITAKQPTGELHRHTRVTNKNKLIFLKHALRTTGQIECTILCDTVYIKTTYFFYQATVKRNGRK